MPNASDIVSKLRNKIFLKFAVSGSIQRITSPGTLNETTAQFEGEIVTTFNITYVDNIESKNNKPINLFDAQSTNQQVKRSKTQKLRSIIILADEGYAPELNDVFIDINGNSYKLREPKLIQFQGIKIAYEIDLND
jgi:hypothetical protein